ncbi:phosphonoacetaldehyde phosphonohydrolase-related protein [Pseudomonas sp. JQ170]|uniref:phosphonoacetaldehyde phosphonohydrolase-related protein n=1 Tax=unclassified Pseudomonas TaxID=196821 RepID=UPI002651AAF0|nr:MULTISPECIES: phosphonoacetaldehyde phosphonohydrolase-related protein [unclassified Pseudomonas]MDN7142807.1 phosphonoacetaldehyde phosphonohydrolase-related protein [Pseudomonas sp. JQ170]WRO74580.1 phosphonoacetaldehyde phosphonohydrolase-related protein [Pseudomonas sp. 170C]
MPDSPAFTALLFGLRGCLVDVDKPSNFPHPTPGALQTLDWLNQQQVPCAWLDELSGADAEHMARPLPDWIKAQHRAPAPWPAPDACWQALMTLKTRTLDGCVLVSGEPRLLQSGLNAGLWTIGLATCSSLCGVDSQQWQALSPQEQERKRGKATLQLFALGVHSVIDHLESLSDCLTDITQRRLKGEKP